MTVFRGAAQPATTSRSSTAWSAPEYGPRPSERPKYKHVAVEVPLGSAQTKYDARCDQWVPNGGVLRCLIHDERLQLVVEIDEQELSLEQFGKLLTKYSGWGHAN